METQKIMRNRASIRWVTICAAAILFTAGCNSMGDTSANFTHALNQYYNAHPSCLWSEAMEFPAQAGTLNSLETRGLDALVDQSLLVRAAGPKKVLVTAPQQLADYQLSGHGRSAWVADPQQPGSGNFCYGHRVVTAIESSSPTTSKDGATTDVIYRYTIAGAPAWAQASETLAAFPGVRTDLSGNQVGHATLTDTSKGWQVTNAPWPHIADSDIYK